MKHDFLNSSDWQKIASRISEQITVKSITGVTESKTYDELRYTAGYVAALQDVLRLPDLILVDDDEDRAISKEEKDVLRLNGSPHGTPNRALTNFRG